MPSSASIANVYRCTCGRAKSRRAIRCAGCRSARVHGQQHTPRLAPQAREAILSAQGAPVGGLYWACFMRQPRAKLLPRVFGSKKAARAASAGVDPVFRVQVTVLRRSR